MYYLHKDGEEYLILAILRTGAYGERGGQSTKMLIMASTLVYLLLCIETQSSDYILQHYQASQLTNFSLQI